MNANINTSTVPVIGRLLAFFLNGPGLEMLATLWQTSKKLWQGLTEEGMYEVLSYESTLELLDAQGKHAHFHKRQRVRYLQNNIIAYQDQAWGDGEILLNYQCRPGVVVDQYRPGSKIYLLISLREAKQRGDTDEFHISWGIRKGFIRSSEQWETEISHHTRYFKMRIIFPKERPPQKAALIEYTRQRTKSLGQEAIINLSDGRWLVWYEIQHPRLYERYILKWEW